MWVSEWVSEQIICFFLLFVLCHWSHFPFDHHYQINTSSHTLTQSYDVWLFLHSAMSSVNFFSLFLFGAVWDSSSSSKCRETFGWLKDGIYFHIVNAFLLLSGVWISRLTFRSFWNSIQLSQRERER